MNPPQKPYRSLAYRSPSMPDLVGNTSRRVPYANNLSTPRITESLVEAKGQVQEPAKFDFKTVDDVASIPVNGQTSPSQQLRIPQSMSAQRSLNSSVDQQSNLSVIDMYGDAESFISTESKPEPSSTQTGTPYTTTTSPPQATIAGSVTASAPASTTASSRKSASKIRLSIESSKTTVSSDRDRYGFKKKSSFVTEDQYNNWWMSYANHCVRRKNKWVQFLNKNGLSVENDSPVRFPARSEKLKRYIRKGIPAEWRGNAWWYFAKGPEKLKNNIGVYDSLVESTANLKNTDTEIIERDLNRTFPDNIHFRPDNLDPASHEPQTETPLIQALRRVLVAFSTYNPTIGYCQSLNFIAGLLLIFMDEEKTFWMLVIITSRYLPGVHDVNLEGVSIDQGVLMLSVQEFLPDTWNKISRIDFDEPTRTPSLKGSKNHDFLAKLPPITLCTSSWFMSVFIGILPIETTLRVWDCFFYEESSILFKTALSIFKIIEPKVLAIQDEMEVFQIVQNSPKSLIDPSVIFDVIFKRRMRLANLTQDEVTRCRKYVTQRRKQAKVKDPEETDASFNRKLLSEPLWQSDYGFKKGLPGVHWNRNLSLKMRSRRKAR